MTRYVGILTAGGDCPGLNAAIRSVGKAGYNRHDIRLIGFRDGFRGLMQDRTMALEGEALSNILTLGGTILGASRDKPHRMPVGGKFRDMTGVILDTYQRHHLDALVCLGGGGTQKNALKLLESGMNVITLPKTIDNDVAMTDVTIGFDTALGIATEAIDRLHSTATSHNRIIVVEVMGHRAGWLALGAGLAGGADVILIPEIPYDMEKIVEAIRARTRQGKHFSIVAVAEGASTAAEAMAVEARQNEKEGAETKAAKKQAKREVVDFKEAQAGHAMRMTQELEQQTGIEARLTILGHLQRGGTPSAADRLLATKLGAVCADLLEQRLFGVMIAARGEIAQPVPLRDVAGKNKFVPLDHPWVHAARAMGISFGD